MSDTDFRTDKRSSSAGLGDKLQETGEELKQRASQAFDATSEVAREKLGELGQAARETASHAADAMTEQVSAQQQAGAEYAQRFAQNIRQAAKVFDKDAPIAARTIEMAADYVEDAAGKMRDGSIRDVIDGVTGFARRQPAAFLGLSVLAGFAVVRFLKASGGQSTSSSSQSYRGSTQNYAGSSQSYTPPRAYSEFDQGRGRMS